MFGGGGFGFSPAMMWGRLLTLEAVQKELELVPEQKEKLKNLAEKAAAKARENFAAMGKLRDLSEEERKTKFTEFGNTMRAQAEQTKKDIEEVLLPHQVERVKQIVLQVRGLGALEDKEVQDALGITEQQKEKMKSLGESMAEKFRGMGRGGDENERKARREKMESARKELEAQILDILTPEQKEKFNKMKGAKVDIDMSQLMPRRPGRGGADQK
jgi:Spy/CpxP family protein refolding chaperone